LPFLVLFPCLVVAAEYLLNRDHKTGIEDYGYGKGYVYLAEEIGKFLKALDVLRMEQGMNIILVAHSHVKRMDCPDSDGFDRYEMKLEKKTCPIIKEWVDDLFFINYKNEVYEDDNGKKKAMGGKPVIYTSYRPQWDAKNRHDLPDELPLDFAGNQTRKQNQKWQLKFPVPLNFTMSFTTLWKGMAFPGKRWRTLSPKRGYSPAGQSLTIITLILSITQ